MLQLLVLFFAFSVSLLSGKQPATSPGSTNTATSLDMNRIRTKAADALQFCEQKKYNTRFCLLADMQLHSGVERMVLWNFMTDTIEKSFPVGHGCGTNRWSYDDSKDNPAFSNTDGSHCSALGKYKIGERGISQWGIKVKYVLHGLEASNSNALKRYIVLHSWEAMPDANVYPHGSPEGWGCPTVSDNNMRYIDSCLKKEKKPTLLWLFR